MRKAMLFLLLLVHCRQSVGESLDDSHPLALCARVHNNTALAGSEPTAILLGTASECQRACVDIYPKCSAVVYYYVRNTTQHHYCYLFEQNSVAENVTLVEQNPPSKRDLVRMLELVAHCHQFDAHPPLSGGEGLATSSDRVDRKKRLSENDEIEAGEWTDWSDCGSGNLDHATRSRECAYGRQLERRGCPARRYQAPAPQRRPPPPPQQHPYPQPQQRVPQPPQQVQLLQPPTRHQPAPQQPPQPQQYHPQQRPEQQRPEQQRQPVDPRQQPSPHDVYARQYQERMSNYRPQTRHPAVSQPAPCVGPSCPAPYTQPTQITVQPPQPPQPQPPRPQPSRYRPAAPPPPLCNAPGCVATPAPITPATWHEWSDWSPCSCTCGDGLMQRRRECSGSFCIGNQVEEAPCSMGPCQTWSEWCEWSECRGRCGIGERVRTRFCTLGTQRCEGPDFESQPCDAGACAEWTSWGEWTGCSVSCGHGGRRSHSRTCLGGQSGDECQGPRVEEGACEALPPCTFWGDWSEWSTCSASCGRGAKRRSRVCQHGVDCLGPAEETLYCDGPPCARWSEWCEWSECSARCGPGQRGRSRVCLTPDGAEGHGCVGPAEETSLCQGIDCCAWTEWCAWSDCDRTCGSGLSVRSRSCVRQSGAGYAPFAADDTCVCDGPDREARPCNPQPCTPQCQWTAWCEWSECSTDKQCEVGIQQRSRQCVGEPGCECLGVAEDTQQCRGRTPCEVKPPC